MNFDDLDLDLGLDLDTGPQAGAPVPSATAALSSFEFANAGAQAATAKHGASRIDVFDDSGLDFTHEPFIAAPAAGEEPVTHKGMLEFDMNSFTLDLEPTTQPANVQKAEQEAAEPAALKEDPLEIKFLLAEEFRQIGDAEGARSLAGEVLGKAKGPLKVKAQAFLNTLS